MTNGSRQIQDTEKLYGDDHLNPHGDEKLETYQEIKRKAAKYQTKELSKLKAQAKEL